MDLRDASGTPLRPSGKISGAALQAASATRLDGDVQLITTDDGERLVPVIVGNWTGYYVLEVRWWGRVAAQLPGAAARGWHLKEVPWVVA